jgi:hypothetical protein
LVPLLLTFAPSAYAADLQPADQAAIQGVIAGQIDAFRHDDQDRAYGFASPDIQAMFGDAGNFMTMVREGFQPVYHPRSYAFDEARAINGMLIQDVAVVGPDGQPHIARYTMEQEPDGSWRIAGCQILAKPSPES